MEIPPELDGALRATLAPNFTPRLWQEFLNRRGPPESLRESTAALLRRHLDLTPRSAAKLARQLARADPRAELKLAHRTGTEIVAATDRRYPEPLTHLADPPPVLYLRGAGLQELDDHAIAVVGSRRPTPYGLRIARTLAGDLASAGITLIAELQNTPVHEAALDANGTTVAVAPGGLLRPEEQARLLERIADRGTVLSEHPLRAPPAPGSDRLVAALAHAILVVEAGRQADRHALDLGRLIMAVPGPVDSSGSRATLRMLQAGAIPVGDAKDVFAALGWCNLPPSELPEEERRILGALAESGATSQELAQATGMREEAAAGLLVTLETRGLVARDAGRFLKL